MGQFSVEAAQLSVVLLILLFIACAAELARVLVPVRPVNLALIVDCVLSLLAWLIGGLTLRSELGWFWLWSGVCLLVVLCARTLAVRWPVGLVPRRALNIANAVLVTATVVLVFRVSDADFQYLTMQLIFLFTGIVVVVQATRLFQESIDRAAARRRLQEQYRLFPMLVGIGTRRIPVRSDGSTESPGQMMSLRCSGPMQMRSLTNGRPIEPRRHTGSWLVPRP